MTSLSPFSVGWEKKAVNPSPAPYEPSDDDSSVPTYPVTVEKPKHGKVSSNHAEAAAGDTVTLTVTPDSGYSLETLTVTDSRGNELKLTGRDDGKYAFTMPGRAVTVSAAFAPLPEPEAGDAGKPCDGGADCPSRRFPDLGGAGAWYHEAVDYVLQNGLMGGYGDGTFGPDEPLSRAQLAQILYNQAGRPAPAGTSPFTDAADGAWYSDAVTWASQRGIVGGYGGGLFGPDDPVTREQLAVMLWRYSGSPAASGELPFHDTGEISAYALDALRWAVDSGVISGLGGGTLAPGGLATRAQAAQMLRNHLER